MAKYIKEIEAIAYTGDNVEEIKEMLGDCFVGTDEKNYVWYHRTQDAEKKQFLRPNIDILVKDKDEDYFWDDRTEEFLWEWKLME